MNISVPFFFLKFFWFDHLATSCEELTHWKRLWCWEGLGAGGEGDDRGWDSWMASLTRWRWVWVNSGSWWWTGRPGVLQFMGSQRVGYNWATELNWTDSPLNLLQYCFCSMPSLWLRDMWDPSSVIRVRAPSPHWKAKSYLLDHQGSPSILFWKYLPA